MMRGRQIKCIHCDGHGVCQNGNVTDPCPEECEWCAGNGHQWQYPGGAIAKWYSGPLVGRDRRLTITEAGRAALTKDTQP